MLTSLTVDYFAALVIDKGKRKLGLTLSLVINLGLLGFFKYYDFIIESINGILTPTGFALASQGLGLSLPLGISFYTFQSMSYTLDVYYDKVKANRNFLNFATYVTMFPQLVAGPIVRYSDIYKQLLKKDISTERIYSGLKRFVLGLGKKMILANSCGYVADNIWASEISDLSTPVAWLGILAYSFQIYFDFSGYSDMAIGLGRMLGFDFQENFNFPYISKSIREFWRRWHISLSTWFRDYLYIPLGGSRKGSTRTYLNLFIVFFITGLWHGASWNFVIWGMFHGFFIALERLGMDRLLARVWVPIQHFYTLFVVIIAWVFFRADDLGQALDYIERMFTLSAGNKGLMDYLTFLNFNIEYKFVLLLALIFSLPVSKSIRRFLEGIPRQRIYLEGAGLILLFIVSLSYIANDSYNPFIYFRF